MIAAFYAGRKNDFGPKTAWVVGQFGTKMVKTDNVAQGKFCINIIKMNNFAIMPIQSRSTARRDLVMIMMMLILMVIVMMISDQVHSSCISIYWPPTPLSAPLIRPHTKLMMMMMHEARSSQGGHFDAFSFPFISCLGQLNSRPCHSLTHSLTN